MSYSTGEGYILTRIQTLANFGAGNASRGKWAILNSGKAAAYAILRPGPFTREFLSGTVARAHWVTVVEVWVRYKDDGTTLTDLEARRQEVIAEFDARRLLGDTTAIVEDAYIRAGREPQEMWKRGGNGPAWLMQELELAWKEETTITFAE